MKIIVIFFLAISLCTSSMATKWTDSGNYDTSWYNDLSESFEISTAKQLAGLIYLCNNGKTFSGKTLFVINDLDMSAHDWVPIDCFDGVLDGKYHKFTGLHVNHKNSTLGPNYFSFALISVLNGAIQNVDLNASFVLQSHGYDEIWVSGMCKTNNGLIKNCIVSGTISALNDGDGVELGYNNSAGAFACINSGTIVNCTNYAEIKSEPYYYDYKTFAYAGGISATNNGNIYNCFNFGDVFAQVGWNSTTWKWGWGLVTHAYAGGITGVNTGTIANVLNLGNVKVNIVKLGNMEGDNGDAGNIVALNSGTINYAYSSSSNVIEAPNILNEGLTLAISQIQNLTYQFTDLLNQNVDALSNDDICYWGNAPSKNNNIPLMLNGFILDTIITDSQQNVATFTAIPSDISSSVIVSKGFEYKGKNDVQYKRAYASDIFSTTVSDLNLSEDYEVRAFVVLKNSRTVFFSHSTFATSGILIETKEATDITATSAILKGVLNSGNVPLKSQGFVWKADGTNNYNIVYSEGQEYQYLLEGLTPNTMYQYQAFVLTQSNESLYGETVNFVTLPVTVTLNDPEIGRNFILVKGIVNINGIKDVTIEYKKSTENQYTKTTVKSNQNGQFECNISSLTPNTNYDFRAYVIYNNSYIYSDTKTYKTLNVNVQTLSALVEESVVLRGEVIGGTNLGKVGFEYRDARHPDIIPSDIIDFVYDGESFNSTICNVLNGNEYKYRALYEETATGKVYGEWVSFIPTRIPEASILNSIAENTEVDFSLLKDVELNNTIVKGVYYNIASNQYGRFDSSDNSLVITQSTNLSQIENKGPGSDEIKELFTGIILKVASGKGSIAINTETKGNIMLATQIGEQSPEIFNRIGKGNNTVEYHLTEDSFVYIYTVNNTANTRSLRVLSDNEVKILGISINPGATDINVQQIAKGESTKDSYFNLDGRILKGVPTQKGVYIVNGRKVVVK